MKGKIKKYIFYLKSGNIVTVSADRETKGLSSTELFKIIDELGKEELVARIANEEIEAMIIKAPK